MLRSSFSDLFGLTYPIMNAPMGGSAGGELAAAVANAGALGMIGGSSSAPGMMSGDWLRREIRLARSLTDRPFGVGFISPVQPPGSTVSNVAELQAVALDEGVTVIGHSFAVREDLYAEARRRGARIIAQVQTVAMAREALAAGAEVLVAQGFDGGGHVGSIGALSIVPAVVDVAGAVPVLAAGGIADGRGLAAALMLGAQGANVGTRFYAAPETLALPFVQQRLLSAGTDDTIWTPIYDRVRNANFGPTVAARVVRNRFTDTWHGREAEAVENAERLVSEVNEARVNGDAETFTVYAGTGVGLVRDVEPAGSIVRGICAEAEQVIRARSAALLV